LLQAATGLDGVVTLYSDAVSRSGQRSIPLAWLVAGTLAGTVSGIISTFGQAFEPGAGRGIEFRFYPVIVLFPDRRNGLRTWSLDIATKIGVTVVVEVSCHDHGYGSGCRFAIRAALAGAAESAFREMT